MKINEELRGWKTHVETFHGSLGSSFFQGINDPLFKNTPIVEGFDPKEVDQREKFLDLVLTATGISKVRTYGSLHDPHRSAGETPTVVAFELEASLRTLG